MLNDLKTPISTHAANDDWRLYEFTRNTGLPRGTFDSPKISPDGWVYIVCAGLIAGWLACALGNLFN